MILAGVVVVIGLALVPPPDRPPPVLDEASFPRAAATSETADAPPTLEELKRRIARVLTREGVPGAAIALVPRDGAFTVVGVGVADVETRTPVDGDTVFRVASITKSFIGLGVMRLVEQGKLDLDQPLRELLPDVAIDNPWEAEAPVTLAHVLEHTAGLDDMRFNEVYADDDEMTPAAALAINPRSRAIRWRPGSRMAYSNIGYGLAGRAIEVATGEPFDQWLLREVIRPLGMPDADFRRTPALAAHLATGYYEPGRTAPFVPIAHRPAGALLASATDLARLVQFWLRRGAGTPIVSTAGLARIERADTLAYGPTAIEYGLGNYGDVEHAVPGRGHDGGLPGFVSQLRYFPELGAGYVVLFNSTHSFRAFYEVNHLVFAYLARGRTFAAPAPAKAPATVPDAAFYRFASPRGALFGFVDRALLGWHAAESLDGIRLDPLVGSPTDLVATADGGFRLPHQSGTSVRFARNRDGTPIMISGSTYAEEAAWWPARARVNALALALTLLYLAPTWAVGVLILAALRRRRPIALGLLLWPAVAGLCMVGFEHVFTVAAYAQVLGVIHPLTVAIWAITLLLGVAGVAGMFEALRWSWRRDRPSLASRLVPTACAIAAFGFVVWLGAHGIIGLCTWAW